MPKMDTAGSHSEAIVLQVPGLNGPLRQNKGGSEVPAAPSGDGISKDRPRATSGPPRLPRPSACSGCSPDPWG